jgi:hypothetical protein
MHFNENLRFLKYRLLARDRAYCRKSPYPTPHTPHPLKIWSLVYMTIFSNFLRSLVLTIIFSFLSPMLLIGCLLLLISFIGHIPSLQVMAEAVAIHIIQFLATFGSGVPLRGLFVISLTCGFVGVLFDIYAYYRCHILRIDS